MKISDDGLKLIKQFEGFSAKPYFCPAGKLTIGYGHVIIASENFPIAGISQISAEDILRKDVSIAESSINENVVVTLQQKQFDALVSFVYNIGISAFEKSKLLRLLNGNEFQLASEQFLKWIYAGGVVQNGLIKRRYAEQKMFI